MAECNFLKTMNYLHSLHLRESKVSLPQFLDCVSSPLVLSVRRIHIAVLGASEGYNRLHAGPDLAVSGGRPVSE